MDIPSRPTVSIVGPITTDKSLSRTVTDVSRRESLALVLLSLTFVFLTLVPDFLGFASARSGTIFMGTLMNPEDTNSYLAKMEQGYQGAWLYSIPFTSEEHAPAFVGGFYLLLGHAARLFDFSIIGMWYAARACFAFLMFLTTFGFIRHFLGAPRPRWIAFVLALTGSGFGWLLLVSGQTNWLGDFPVDFKMPEAHLFFSALTFPHFAAGVALILGSLWLSFRAFETGRFVFALGASSLNLALAVVYPFMIYLIALVLLLNWIANCFSTRRFCVRAGIGAGISLLLPLPLLLYYLIILQTNPVFRAWDTQAVTVSPNLLHYLVAYGAMILLAVPTIHAAKMRPLWLWVIASAALVYAPLNPQRRFVEGVQVPLSILAAAGLTTYCFPHLRDSRLFRGVARRPHYSPEGLERLVVVGVLLVLAVSNLYVLLSMSWTAAVMQPYPFFRSQAEVEAVDWAGAHLPAGAVVLSSYETGSLIPTRTGLRTVIGHWAETKDFARKYAQVSTFFDAATTETARADLIHAERVQYLFFGPQERRMGGLAHAFVSGLQPVYENESVTIFRVDR